GWNLGGVFSGRKPDQVSAQRAVQFGEERVGRHSQLAGTGHTELIPIWPRAIAGSPTQRRGRDLVTRGPVRGFLNLLDETAPAQRGEQRGDDRCRVFQTEAPVELRECARSTKKLAQPTPSREVSPTAVVAWLLTPGQHDT